MERRNFVALMRTTANSLSWQGVWVCELDRTISKPT